VSTVLHWSDSRKRSRFTAAGGVAVTAMPMSDLRQQLDELHASTESQLSTARTPDKRSDDAPCADDTRPTLLRRLMEVEAAQQRIADGSYGVCLGCGRPIPVARLQTAPDTSCCHSCQISLMEAQTTERNMDPCSSARTVGARQPESQTPTERGVNRHDT
jgi:RNA polymerase-binding transcription factor